MSWDQNKSAVGRVLILYIGDPGFIPRISMVSQALPGEIPECRARSKLEHLLVSLPKPKQDIVFHGLFCLAISFVL